MSLTEILKAPKCGKIPDVHGPLYERLFSTLLHRTPISLLEIGVWYGESLRAWKKFFGDQVRLYGIDTQLVRGCEDLATYFIGDQSYDPFMEHVARLVGSLDIVIDDGGHFADDQQVSFKHLWPVVSKGGIYIIEDLWVADDRAVRGFESTLAFLDKLPYRKEFYKGTNDFEKDICVLFKE